MQPCFTPAKQVKASVNLLSILTADLSFENMDIKTSIGDALAHLPF